MITLCGIAAVLIYKATGGGGVVKGTMENTGEVARVAEEVATKVGEATANVAGDRVKSSARQCIIYRLLGYFK